MDATDSSSEPKNCPECGAPLATGAEKCWLCGVKEKSGIPRVEKQAPQHPANPYASPAPPTGDNLSRTFSLSTMFLWTTLVAVFAGVARIAPGLGIGLAILSFPAALRTIGTVGRRKRRGGESIGVAEKVETFVASFGLVLVIVLGAAGAFTATCFPLGLAAAASNQLGLILVAIVAGIAAAVTVAYFLIRALWRQQE